MLDLMGGDRRGKEINSKWIAKTKKKKIIGIGQEASFSRQPIGQVEGLVASRRGDRD
jgi:hypothetical protein